MTFAQFLFVSIDKLFDHSQNDIKMLKFKDVNFEIETDVPYGPTEAEKLDTYYVKKDGDAKYPVFFYIHGGGLSRETKSTDAGLRDGRQTKASSSSTSTMRLVRKNFSQTA